jgi:hypothetical protein
MFAVGTPVPPAASTLTTVPVQFASSFQKVARLII